jgi:pimeloyl-ACP methyl ester carboxylesterase
VPPSITTPLYYARDLERALREIFAACGRDARCSRAYPSPDRELREVLARLDRSPASVTVRHPGTGVATTVRVTRDVFAEKLRWMLYGAAGARALPHLVSAAARGDLRPFVERVLAVRGDAGISLGMWLTVTCAEDVRRLDEARVTELTDGTALGDYRVRQQQAACAAWPVALLSAQFGTPRRIDAPSLLITGAWDPVTPPVWAEETARILPRSRRVVVPYGAHGPSGACVADLVTRFVRSANPRELDESCLARTPPPAFDVPGPT